MDLREFVARCVERNRGATLALVQGLTPQQLRWRPGPEANPVGFLLFHLFRVEDWYFHVLLASQGELWQREGWARRWKLPSRAPDAEPLRTSGNGWTPREVGDWQPPPLAELLEYGQAVRSSGLQVLRNLDLDRLEQVVRPGPPQWTVAFVLLQSIYHEAIHNGQIDYVLGQMRAEAK